MNTEALDELRKLTDQRDEADRRAKEMDMFWRWEIERQVKAGVSVAQIAEAAGVSRQRVYQVRDGRR